MQSIRVPLSARLSRVSVFDVASVLLIAALAAAVCLLFRDYGISNDEEVQHRYGELILAYYASGFADKTLFHFKNLYLYGGLFDIVAVLLARLLPFDLYLIRHLLSGLIGVGGIIATAATARLIAGSRAGFLAALLLALCGVWFGAMFNHTKDIPFAAAMMTGTYFLFQAVRDLPRPRWHHVLGFGLFLGAALGLRALGLFLVGYAVLAVALHAPWKGPHAGVNFILQSLLRFVPAFLLGYAVMIAAWPWAALGPFNFLRALFAFAHFDYPIRTIIAGHIYDMADVPWWYVPAYLAIKLPLVLLFGAVSALVMACWRRFWTLQDADARRRDIALIAFMTAFPVLCEALTEGPAFDGLRHFSFVVPPAAVLAGIGLDRILAALRTRPLPVRAFASAALALSLLWQAIVLIRLHPYEHLFYNALVGGLEGASRRYVMDYWVNIMPEAVRALESHLDREGPKSALPGSYTVAICGEKFSFEDYAGRRLKWSGGWKEADFFIAPTHMNCDNADDGKTIVSIERLGVAIGIVKDRRALVRPGLAQGN